MLKMLSISSPFLHEKSVNLTILNSLLFLLRISIQTLSFSYLVKHIYTIKYLLQCTARDFLRILHKFHNTSITPNGLISQSIFNYDTQLVQILLYKMNMNV